MKPPLAFAPIATSAGLEATVRLVIEAARRGGLHDLEIAWQIFFADVAINEELIEMAGDIFNDLGMLVPDGEEA